MKRWNTLAAVTVILVSATAFAGSFDGTYKYTSRTKDGAPDMAGWWGMMVVTNNTMSRIYHSPDGKTEKYYVGSLNQQGDTYKVKYTQAYKPEYVGNEHMNKITMTGNTLTIEDTNGKFKEVWMKK